MAHRLSAFAGMMSLALASTGFSENHAKPSSPTRDHGGMTSPAAPGSQGSQDLHQAMMDGMQDMRGMKMTGDTDVDYASMMIRHHEQAIAMSRAQLQGGRDPDVKRKANEIIAASEKDIADLKKWRSQQDGAAR